MCVCVCGDDSTTTRERCHAFSSHAFSKVRALVRALYKVALKRERESVCVCYKERESVCVCAIKRERESVCVCYKERERERVCVL